MTSSVPPTVRAMASATIAITPAVMRAPPSFSGGSQIFIFDHLTGDSIACSGSACKFFCLPPLTYCAYCV